MNFYKLNELATEFRSDIGINHADSIDFFPVIVNKLKNLTIVFLDMDAEISGACYKFDTQKIMFINSNHTKGRQTFTAAHELYHLFYSFHKCRHQSYLYRLISLLLKNNLI